MERRAPLRVFGVSLRDVLRQGVRWEKKTGIWGIWSQNRNPKLGCSMDVHVIPCYPIVETLPIKLSLSEDSAATTGIWIWNDWELGVFTKDQGSRFSNFRSHMATCFTVDVKKQQEWGAWPPRLSGLLLWQKGTQRWSRIRFRTE